MLPTVSQADRRYDATYFKALAREHRWELVRAHLLAIAATLLTVPLPLLFPALVDELLLRRPGPVTATVDRVMPAEWRGPALYISAMLFTTLVLRLAATGLGVWQEQQFTRIAKESVFRMRRSLLEHLGRVSLAGYETLGSGTVASHFVTDLATIDSFLSATVSRFLISILTVAGIAGVLLWMHWQLALFIILLNPLVIYLTTRLGRWVKNLKRKENQAVEEFQEALVETLDAIQELRAGNREGRYIGRLVERARRVRDLSTAYCWKSSAAGRFTYLLYLFGFDIFRAAAILAVLVSSLTIGEMLAVYSYLWFMMGPIRDLLDIQYALYAARAALERVNRLLALPLEPEPRFGSVENPFQGSRAVGMEVEGLRLAYGQGPFVLDGIDLIVEPAEKVALVGASGGGKSTFVRALLGLYPHVSGAIRFGGVPADRIGWETVRRHVATVLQVPAMFNDTVRANLTLGEPCPDAALWRALEFAELRDEVERLPNGLDTQIGRQGIRFSGGQRQRLAIARLLLADPRIVILDEATSALDTETERRLQERLAGFLAGRTTLLIAHRLSTLRMADRVFVFEHGRIAEQGRHSELLYRGGLYSRLYTAESTGTV